MLKIDKHLDGSKLTIVLTGRLDTMSSPELEKEIKSSIEGITDLVLDLAGLDYLSSSGLRVILSAQKVMNKQGEMTIIHVNDMIMDIFEITGFSDILTIQ